MDSMTTTILDELQTVEREHGVRVLAAIESGSRAWGFDSPDSDYDVRFVYVHPVENYLRLDQGRDTIEWKLDDVLDINGWDLAKFLRLVHASNPSAFEWLGSPIVYRESPEFAAVRQVAPTCFSPLASVHHYLGMAKTNAAALSGDAVKLKKYLYVMRALLAARWAVQKATPVPMLFEDLANALLEPEMRGVVAGMLAEKRVGDERELHARIPEVDAWIVCARADLEERCARVTALPKPNWDALDQVFVSIVMGER
ncbi:DNA polymerase beta superfamily protein [Slackia heliotrinireducens]|nr:nucleotidyltransferase domain-containing protein [Slackia heliotrinireducens]